MARIRTIKPEFWEDEKIGQLTPWSRLAFIGTWNLCDDEGLLRWTPDYINASLFMYDDFTPKRVQTFMDEIVAAGLVLPYKGGNAQQRLGWIINFRRHQKINRPMPGKFPPPSIQNRDIQRVYAERDRWVCHLCTGAIAQVPTASPDISLSMDHLIPRSAGGSDYPSNISAAHQSCNKSRRDRAIETFTVPSSVTEGLRYFEATP